MKFLMHYAGFIMGFLSVILFIIAGPGSRIGLYPFTAGIAMMMSGAFIGIAGMIVSVISLAAGVQGMGYAVTGLITGALSSGSMLFIILSAMKVPAIHDISTDTVNPPEFVSILTLRKNAPNGHVYEGGEIAKKQLTAYPEIKTIRLGSGADKAFQKSSSAVKALGWETVEENRGEGRIEAVDTTLMFGFKDDIIIRVLADAKGSRVDIRSVSLVGVGDLGTNAKRIGKFMKLIMEE